MQSILGRVVQGVSQLREARQALTVVAPDDEAEVELQLQRVAEALMPEYRRDAMNQLKELLVDNPKAQLAVGRLGLPVLVSVLRDDRDDLELLRGALECLVAAMAPTHPPPAAPTLSLPYPPTTDPGPTPAGLGGAGPGSGHRGGGGGAGGGAAGAQGRAGHGGVSAAEAQAVEVNAELFARKPEHVALLLGLLEDEPVGVSDFYVHYHTVQLLTLLLQSCAFKLQAAVLASPTGVVRLMDMLTEREVLRNEVLLLMVALTRANEEVQKIAAFEGAFDRVLSMMHEEGGADGGVVVQDCLELLNNLLRGNQANQRLFREMGFSGPLTRLLARAVPAPPPLPPAPSPPDTTPASEQWLAVSPDPSDLAEAEAAGALTAAGGGGRAGEGVGGGGGAGGAARPAGLASRVGGLLPFSARAMMTGAGAVAAVAAAAAQSANRGLQGHQGEGGGGRGEVGGLTISAQKAAILLCALEGVQLMVGSGAEELHRGPAPPPSAPPAAAAAGTPGSAGQSDCPPPSPALAASQAAFLAAGCLEAAAGLSLTRGGVACVAVRAQALRVLADLVRRCPQGQDQLGALRVALPPADPLLPLPLSSHQAQQEGLPALQAVLRLALHSPWPAEQAAAEQLLAAFCCDNPDGQSLLLSTMAPVAPRPHSSAAIAVHGGHTSRNGVGTDAEEAGSTFGGELLAALLQHQGGQGGTVGEGGLAASCRAALVLQHLLAGNPAAKQRLLALPIELTAARASSPTLLMPRLVANLRDCLRLGGSKGAAAASLLLRLLIVWLVDCPLAVAALLEPASHLPLLVDLATDNLGASDATLMGLAALVLGLCLVYSTGTSHSAMVADVLLARVGFGTFFGRLEALTREPSFQAATVRPAPPRALVRAAVAAAVASDPAFSEQGVMGPGPDEVAGSGPWDWGFTQLVLRLEGEVRRAAMHAFTHPAGSAGGAPGSGPGAALPLAEGSEAEQLAAALAAVRRLEGEVLELQGRNKALAQDLFAVISGGSGHEAGSSGEAGAAAGHRPAFASSLAAGATSGADIEARVAAEMRASRAELEAASAKQQVSALSSRLAAAEQTAQEASEAARQATDAAAKHRSDLQDLSSAFNALEAHAFSLEGQVRDLQAKLAQAQASAQASTSLAASHPLLLSEPEVEERVAAAVALARQQATEEAVGQLAQARAQLAAALAQADQARQAVAVLAEVQGQGLGARVKAAAGATVEDGREGEGTPGRPAGEGGLAAGGPGGLYQEDEVEARVAAAVAALEGQVAEAEEQLTDLLVCLGQEEQKVALLSEALMARGIDVDAMLASIQPEQEA